MDKATNILSKVELELIRKVIDEILKPWKLERQEGSFILVGQKRDERAQEILRFNFRDGKKDILADTDPYYLYGNTSNRAVEEAIDELLAYPSKQLSCGYSSHPANFGQLSNGIYYLGKPRAHAIVINATFGRFLASVSVDPYGPDSQLLAGVAQSIGYLATDDRILSTSVEQTISHNFKENLVQRITSIVELIATQLKIVPSRMLFFD